MEMTKFERLLDNVDAAYIAHNDYFKANENNLDDQRLAEFEKQIDEAHDKVDEALKPLDDELQRKLTDLAYERAKIRPRRLRPWVDPKVIREDARIAAAEQKRRVWGNLSDSEREESYRSWGRELQQDIDSQGGKCAQCGEPLDIQQQMLFRPPDMICDTCCYEMFDDRNLGDRAR
jgi:predicted transcriptional regulator